MKKSKIDSKLYQLTLEKMVIGLEEPILVKGVGEIIAKVDSGNGGYNVIHGEDLTIQGDILTFKTHNKDGEDRRISKKIKDTLNVNIGGGHIQERPVVELDVQFGGQEYKKVLFSVTDRSGNDNKVLISKDFVGKELDALIDVTKNKIADDGIEVEYVSEGVLSAAGNAAGGIAKWAGKKAKDGAIETGKRAAEAVGVATDARSNVSKAKKGPNGEKMYKVKTKGNQKKGSWVDRFYAASQRFKRWVDGNGKLFDDIEEFVTGPALLEKFLQTDPEAVRKAVIKETDIINSLGVNPNSIQVYKILDFLGGCCVENKYVKEDEKKKKKELMDELKDAQKQIEELQKKMEEAEKNKPKDGESAEGDGDSKDNKTEEQEETIIKEDAADASTIPPSTQPTAPESPPADANNEASGNNEEKGNNNENPETQIQNITKKVEAKKEELTKYKDIEEGRDFFVIYYAAFTKTKDGEALSEGKNITMGTPEQLVLQNGPSIMEQKINDAVVKNFASQISTDMGKNKSRGVFAYCTGGNIPRKAIIIKDVLVGADDNQNSETKGAGTDKEIEEFVKQYKEISDKVLAIATKMGQKPGPVDLKYIENLIQLAGGSPTSAESPEIEEFVKQYSVLNNTFHKLAGDMITPEQLLDEQLIDDLIKKIKESAGKKSTDEQPIK